ncbi:MAG: hypothetical protein ABJL99_13490 [Aliishimia sp.]
MEQEKAKLISFYLYGFMLVFGQAIIVSVLAVWGLQTLAFLFGETFEWGAVLRHLILSLTLLAFFPGQQIWTFRMRGPDQQMYTIVGCDPTDKAPEDQSSP